MQEKLKNNSYWLQKVAICLAFFGLLSVKKAEAYGLPPLISVPPLGVSVQNGGTITLTATIGVSLTPLTVRWYCNGYEIKTGIQTTSVPIVGTTISLGKMLGLHLVAEGIESAAVAELLKSMGCDEGQGYHFGMPMPAAEFTQRLLTATATAA